MSTYAELKAAVRGYLQRTVTVSDVLPGSSVDADTEIDRMILQGANNAVRRAENLCDFAVNEVEANVIVPAGQRVKLTRLTDLITGDVFDMAKVIDGVYSYSDDAGETRTWPIKLMTNRGYQRYKHNLGSVNRVVGVLRNNRLQFLPPLDEDVTVRMEGYRRFERFSEYAIKVRGAPLTDNAEDVNGIYNVVGDTNNRSRYRMYVDGVLKGGIAWSGTQWQVFEFPVGVGPNMFIYSADDVGSPDQVETWQKASDDDLWTGSVVECGRENYLTQNAFEYLQWSCISEVNHYLKIFVPRQDGALPPPDRLADRALEEFIRDEEYNSADLNG